jgi:hypothetical protein
LTPVQAAPFAAQSASQLVLPSRVAMLEKHVSPPAWTAAPSPLDELSAAKWAKRTEAPAPKQKE